MKTKTIPFRTLLTLIGVLCFHGFNARGQTSDAFYSSSDSSSDAGAPLQVTISPSSAADAGAQWRVDGGPWQNSGATVRDLSSGTHTVTFNSVSGWDSPSSQLVSVVTDETTQTSGFYEQRPIVITGALSVTGTLGKSFTYTIIASNNPTGFAASGLPSWLTLDGATGVLSGTAVASGTSSIVLTATNAFGSGTAMLVLNIQNRYTAWRSQCFTAAQLSSSPVSDGAAMPAGEGISNLIKYVLDLNPRVCGLSGLPKLGTITLGGSGYLTLTYSQLINNPDIAYAVATKGD